MVNTDGISVESPIDIIVPTMLREEDIVALVAEIKATAGCAVRVFATCQPVSASKNRNIGIDQSTSDPVIMVDDDIEQFPHGWVQKLIGVLEQNPKCVMVSPQLAKLDGSPNIMMGNSTHKREGVSVSAERKLCTACIAIRRNQLRFDEAYIGSGFEDNDYCFQLQEAYPDAEFCVCHDVWVVHRNEMKNQGGQNWEHNRRHCRMKWGKQ